jgi:pyruvate/2-oxoglutarate dehydrogenase complex dihydrolipoamide acyltransferase (E2) component
VTRGDVSTVVTATGTINPVVTVLVGSQVSGTIKSLYADFNSRVKQGEVIAQIDPAIFQAQVDQARATVLTNQANLLNSQSNLENAKANLAKAEVARARGLFQDPLLQLPMTRRGPGVVLRFFFDHQRRPDRSGDPVEGMNLNGPRQKKRKRPDNDALEATPPER